MNIPKTNRIATAIIATSLISCAAQCLNPASAQGMGAAIPQPQQTVAPVITPIPGPGDLTNSGLNDMGELGRQTNYDCTKRFWGDDSISQGAERLSRPIGEATQRIIPRPELLRKLGQSLINAANAQEGINIPKSQTSPQQLH